MAYVAMGTTDWEIGHILGIAQATAHLHVENARRKLGGANRAHAVARMAAFDLL
jgi:DNA-binding CsgD family transcriptional regulator